MKVQASNAQVVLTTTGERRSVEMRLIGNKEDGPKIRFLLDASCGEMIPREARVQKLTPKEGLDIAEPLYLLTPLTASDDGTMPEDKRLLVMDRVGGSVDVDPRFTTGNVIMKALGEDGCPGLVYAVILLPGQRLVTTAEANRNARQVIANNEGRLQTYMLSTEELATDSQIREQLFDIEEL